VTAFLFLAVSILIGSIFFMGNLVFNDVKRLNNAFVTFSNDNSDKIDATTKTVKTYIAKIYPKEAVNIPIDLESVTDSLSNNTEMITKAFSGVSSFFTSSDDVVEKSKASLNWWTIIPFSIVYYLYILYTFPYFSDKFSKYLGEEKKRMPYLTELKSVFKNVMSSYMKQRTFIVLICTVIFITSFSIIGLPGAIILGGLAGLLCYASHFHYYVLLPLSLSCWVLSVENDQSFFLYFGLITAIFILVSILEEMVFFPKIMKGVSSMNPAIMMLSFCIFNYLFGTIGILIALPFTTVLLIYLDKILILRRKELEQQSH
jgi:predicted PurR-regulated permease PerM